MNGLPDMSKKQPLSLAGGGYFLFESTDTIKAANATMSISAS